MKARVKATGEIVEVECVGTSNKCHYEVYKVEDLDFDNLESPDYWTRLEHQAAIAAMGGICGNTTYNESSWESMAEDAILAAHFFIQKLKEKEERK